MRLVPAASTPAARPTLYHRRQGASRRLTEEEQ
jgi:hypothetical protein